MGAHPVNKTLSYAGQALGYTAFIMTRPDIFNGVPFPAVLPIASVKLGPAEIMGTFIPKLNGGVNHGNVAYFFGRIQF